MRDAMTNRHQHPSIRWQLDFRETPRKPEPDPDRDAEDERKKADWLRDNQPRKLPTRGTPE